MSILRRHPNQNFILQHVIWGHRILAGKAGVAALGIAAELAQNQRAAWFVACQSALVGHFAMWQVDFA